MLNILLVILYLYCCLHLTYGKCPPKEILSPCECKDEAIILCAGTEKIDLKTVFNAISANLTKEEKKFYTFILNNTAITEIEEKAFFDVTFKRIEIYAKNLKRIHANAFLEYNSETIEEFHQFGDSSLGGDEYSDEVFIALSSLVNAREISFEETHLNKLQSHAFKLRTGAQNHLVSLDFGGKAFGDPKENLQITSVGNYSFYYLAALQSINLQHQRIDRIAIHAFDIWKPSEKQMRISLIKNKIDDKSIEIGAFTNAKRPLFIELGDNNLTYIEERVFGPVLRMNKNNLIYFDNNPFNCDCRMEWLRKEKEFYVNQVKYILCHNYKTPDGNFTDFWTISERNFQNCVD
jgi:hypothetical protein